MYLCRRTRSGGGFVAWNSASVCSESYGASTDKQYLSYLWESFLKIGETLETWQFFMEPWDSFSWSHEIISQGDMRHFLMKTWDSFSWRHETFSHRGIRHFLMKTWDSFSWRHGTFSHRGIRQFLMKTWDIFSQRHLTFSHGEMRHCLVDKIVSEIFYIA